MSTSFYVKNHFIYTCIYTHTHTCHSDRRPFPHITLTQNIYSPVTICTVIHGVDRCQHNLLKFYFVDQTLGSFTLLLHEIILHNQKSERDLVIKKNPDRKEKCSRWVMHVV